MLTTEQLDAIRERCKRATPGPWIQEGETGVYITDGTDSIALASMLKDASFIVHSREDIPALLDVINTLDAHRNDYRVLLSDRTREMKMQLEFATDRADGWKKMYEDLRDNGFRKLAELESDRDRWKARCEVMKQIIQSEEMPCEFCSLKGNRCDPHSRNGHSQCKFELDEARFAGAGGGRE